MRPIGRLIGTMLTAACLVGGMAVATTAPAQAQWRHGHDWRRHEWRHDWRHDWGRRHHRHAERDWRWHRHHYYSRPYGNYGYYAPPLYYTPPGGVGFGVIIR